MPLQYVSLLRVRLVPLCRRVQCSGRFKNRYPELVGPKRLDFKQSTNCRANEACTTHTKIYNYNNNKIEA